MTPGIVLHVGAPKTASTYLQKRLRAGADRLRTIGVHVPVLPAVARMAGNAKLLATALSAKPSLSFRRAFPEIDAAALEPAAVVAELLADWRADRETVVLSAENFRPEHAAALRELLPASAPCAVVLFVRRQDDWIESYFNQLVKSGDIGGDLSTFVAALCDTEGERFCRPDWSAHRRAWHSAFGDCRVVFYDEARSDVFRSFMDAAGLGYPPDLTDVEPAQVSLDLHQLAYLLQLGQRVGFAEFLRRRAASAEASRRLGAPRPRSLLSAADRARLRTRFDESNRRLAAALGRLDDAPLRIAAASDDACDLDELYASDAYLAHRALADEIYAARPA